MALENLIYLYTLIEMKKKMCINSCLAISIQPKVTNIYNKR